jgi:hypothetical protein
MLPSSHRVPKTTASCRAQTAVPDDEEGQAEDADDVADATEDGLDIVLLRVRSQLLASSGHMMGCRCLLRIADDPRAD